MEIPVDLQQKIDEFAQTKSLTRDEAVLFILNAWFARAENPRPEERGLAPDELNASNDG